MTSKDDELRLYDKDPGSGDDDYESEDTFEPLIPEPEYIPTNAEIMAEIKKTRRTINTLLFFYIITLIALIAAGYYLYTLIIIYKAEIDQAFETMKKIKAMVEQLEADYGGYSNRIEEFFKTVNELRDNLDNLNRILGSLSNLRLPF